MSDGDLLLRAILLSPDEDTPRLIYADWLDENGQPERAEFIRIQIELSQLETPDSDADPKRGLDVRMNYVTPPAFDRLRAIRARARELFTLHAPDWSENLPGPRCRAESYIDCKATFIAPNEVLEYTYRRGFPEIKPGLPVECIRPGAPFWIIEGGLCDMRKRPDEEDGRVEGFGPDGMVRVRILRAFGSRLGDRHLRDFTYTFPRSPHGVPKTV